MGANGTRVNGTNPRAQGTNPRAKNYDAVMTGDSACPFGCVHGWYSHPDGFDVECELHPEEAA